MLTAPSPNNENHISRDKSRRKCYATQPYCTGKRASNPPSSDPRERVSKVQAITIITIIVTSTNHHNHNNNNNMGLLRAAGTRAEGRVRGGGPRGDIPELVQKAKSVKPPALDACLDALFPTSFCCSKSPASVIQRHGQSHAIAGLLALHTIASSMLLEASSSPLVTS